MALEKDAAIHAVLNRLWARLGADAFVVTDHWDADLYAIGISSPHNRGVLVYISCYGTQPGRYGYELELPAQTDAPPYQVAGRSSDVSFEELARVVADHLKHAMPPA
jgi:hypothetical protein